MKPLQAGSATAVGGARKRVHIGGVDRHTVPRTVGLVFTSYAGMDIGRPNGGVVDLAYEDKAPYAFTGAIDKVTFDLKPQAVDDEQAILQAVAQGNVAQGAGG